MHRIKVNRQKSLAEQPEVGHNRFHPDLTPTLTVKPGEDVLIETLDAYDGQIQFGDPSSALEQLDVGRVHPLTGPIHIEGAVPGDGLEVEFLDVISEPTGLTGVFPGLGLLQENFREHFLVHWNIENGWASSPQIPGVRIPGDPFMGIAATAPSISYVQRWTAREQRLIDRGGVASPPDAHSSVPHGACALHGLRTIPPRENGGNFDVKQLTAGSRLVLPVFVDGALFSLGDGHFSQGDGEVCVTAIEIGATALVRFKIHKGAFAKRSFQGPVFYHDSFLSPAQKQLQDRFIGVMGYPITADGEQDTENLLLACRNAATHMIELLQERGFSALQAYVICSVAGDLRIGNVVDAPNYTVSMVIPEAIFAQ